MHVVVTSIITSIIDPSAYFEDILGNVTESFIGDLCDWPYAFTINFYDYDEICVVKCAGADSAVPNGNAAGCPALLLPGAYCYPECDVGFLPEGVRECFRDGFHDSFACVPILEQSDSAISADAKPITSAGSTLGLMDPMAFVMAVIPAAIF